MVDALGRVLATRSFPTTGDGCRALAAWLGSYGSVVLVGIEGTGAYAAGLQRALHNADIETVVIDRPDRTVRRLRGKDDTIDAIAAARIALAGDRHTTPTDRGGSVEGLRNICIARRSAMQQRATAQRQIRSLIVTAPTNCAASCAPCRYRD